jgi:hypothetical protein
LKSHSRLTKFGKGTGVYMSLMNSVRLTNRIAIIDFGLNAGPNKGKAGGLIGLYTSKGVEVLITANTTQTTFLQPRFIYR